MKNNTIAIVVTYNRLTLLRECIERLLKIQPAVDVMVVDNASTDGTDHIKEEYPDIMYFNTGKNSGGAGGFNYGLKKAYPMGYKYFWMMDDDTMVTEDSLSELLKAKDALNNHFGFLSSLALWTDGKLCKMNYHIPSDDWNEYKDRIMDAGIKIKQATFVSFFVSREAVKKCGLPIKEYFIWGDDSEYSLRISKEFPCYLVYKSQVIHKMKSNNGSMEFADETDRNRINRYYYSVRNDYCSAKRQGRKAKIKEDLFLYRRLMEVLKKPVPYKKEKLKILRKGWRDWHHFNPPIEYVE